MNMNGNIAVRFNGENQYVKTPSTNYINITGDTVGFSIFARFNVHSVNNSDTILFQKMDDTNPNYGYEAWFINVPDQQPTQIITGNFISENFDLSNFGGNQTNNYLDDNYDTSYNQPTPLPSETSPTTLHFIVKWNGVYYKCEASSISLNTWYDVWFIFDKVNLAVKMYVNNVLVTTTSTVTSKMVSGTDTSLCIGSSNNQKYYFNGYIQDFRFWNEKLITAPQIGYQWVNKLTISNIPFNRSAVVGYSIIPQGIKVKSTDTITISDSVVVTYKPSNPFLRPLSDSITLSESLGIIKNPVKVSAPSPDTITISDSVAVQKISILTKVGQFVKSTQTTGLPFSQSITGLGFKPRFIIFWGTNSSDVTGIIADHYDLMWGFSDGTNERGFSIASKDNASTSEAAQMWHSFAINDVKSDQQVLYQATCSFDPDGFSINWISNNGGPHVINYLVVGGSNIVNVEVGSYAMPATATGNHSKTGLAFKPDAVVFMPTDYTTVNNTGTRSNWGLGFAISSTQRASMNNWIHDGQATSDTNRYLRADKCATRIDSATGTVSKEADFVSFNNDGWTLNFTTNNVAGNADLLNYLAFKGCRVFQGKFTSTAGLGIQTITGVGFRPKAVMAWTHGLQVQSSTPTGSAKFSFGAATDSLNRYVSAGNDQDGQSVTVNAVVTHNNRFIKKIDAASTASASVIQFEADFVGMTDDGFSINNTVNNGTTVDVIFLCIG